jgi:hypothetical protein
MICKQAQLAGCPAALANEARFGKACFLTADLGDGIAACVDFVCDGAQQLGTYGARRPPKTCKCLFCCFDGSINLRRRSGLKSVRGSMSGRRSEGRAVTDPLTGDQVFSSKHWVFP